MYITHNYYLSLESFLSLMPNFQNPHRLQHSLAKMWWKWSQRSVKVVSIECSDGNPYPLWKRIHISGGLNSILIFIKHFLSILKISKTFVFFLTGYGQGSRQGLTRSRLFVELVHKTNILIKQRHHWLP